VVLSEHQLAVFPRLSLDQVDSAFRGSMKEA
jgi:hypothetical protein